MLSVSEKEQEQEAGTEGVRNGGAGGKDRDLGSNLYRVPWVTVRTLGFTLGKW